jgi:GDP-L-fucose synthase
MENNVLVLGATGFVGGFITKHLQDRYCVYSPTRQELDLTDYQSVLNYFAVNKIDVVVNCAGSVDSNLINFNADSAKTNLLIFGNLYAARNQFTKLINIGSGAEFDRSRGIDQFTEEMLFLSQPKDHYGLSKNIISRMSYNTDNFYTLRLFGVFGRTESSKRLLKKVISGEEVDVADRYFDYFYINDLIPVLEYYISNTPKHKDINVVYASKILLSEFLRKFCELHKASDNNIKLSGSIGLNYTGSATKILELELPFIGIDQGLKDYI